MMEKLTRERVIEFAEKYSLKPIVIKGSDVVQLAKKESDRYQPISWDEFFDILEKKNLAVYISKGGYMRIMGDDIYE